MLQYPHESYNSCYLSSLASVLHRISDERDSTALANFIEESLTLQKNKFKNIINFSNAIIKNKLRHIGEQHLIINIKKPEQGCL